MATPSNLLSFNIKQDDLCTRLGGGLPKGALLVMVGPVGAGKSVICQRLTEGLLKNGARVAYVSTELTTRSMLDQMESLNYHEAWKAIPAENYVFVPTHPTIGARSPRGDRLGRLLKAKKLYELDVIIFDTFSKLLGDHMHDHSHKGEGAKPMDVVEAVLHLFKRLTGLGKTIVLTVDPDEAPQASFDPFIAEADVFLRINKERVGATTSRQIIVERLSRATQRYNETIGFRVEPRVGIVIEIRAVLG